LKLFSLIRRRKIALLGLFMLSIAAGCSAQPMTLDQEMATTGIAAGVGAAGGALVGSQTHYSLPLAVFIGAAGTAALVWLYEETKREATAEPSSSN